MLVKIKKDPKGVNKVFVDFCKHYVFTKLFVEFIPSFLMVTVTQNKADDEDA